MYINEFLKKYRTINNSFTGFANPFLILFINIYVYNILV